MFHNVSIAVGGRAGLHQPRSSSTSWDVGEKIKLVCVRAKGERMFQEHRGAAGGTQISQPEAGRRYPEIPARSDQFGNWKKETWGRSAQELVYQPHHWLQTRGVRAPLSPASPVRMDESHS